MSKSGNVTVEIPAETYGKLEKMIEGSEFKTVSEYVAFVMLELIKSEGGEKGEGMSGEEEEEVRRRLKALGYMD